MFRGSIPELKQIIYDKSSEINVKMGQILCRDVADRIQSCIEPEGERFEHLK